MKACMVFPSCLLVEKPLYVQVLLPKLGIYGPTTWNVLPSSTRVWLYGQWMKLTAFKTQNIILLQLHNFLPPRHLKNLNKVGSFWVNGPMGPTSQLHANHEKLWQVEEAYAIFKRACMMRCNCTLPWRLFSLKDDGPLTLYYIWLQSNIAMWQA
jgi:hypothetical protein